MTSHLFNGPDEFLKALRRHYGSETFDVERIATDPRPAVFEMLKKAQIGQYQQFRRERLNEKATTAVARWLKEHATERQGSLLDGGYQVQKRCGGELVLVELVPWCGDDRIA